MYLCNQIIALIFLKTVLSGFHLIFPGWYMTLKLDKNWAWFNFFHVNKTCFSTRGWVDFLYSLCLFFFIEQCISFCISFFWFLCKKKPDPVITRIPSLKPKWIITTIIFNQDSLSASDWWSKGLRRSTNQRCVEQSFLNFAGFFFVFLQLWLSTEEQNWDFPTCTT